MSGNLAVSNNLSVAGSITSTNLTSTTATIPNLTCSNLTVSGTTNTGTFQNLTTNSMNTNTLSATTSITSPTIFIGAKNVGTSVTTLESNMTTAQTNITNLQTKTTNQTYDPNSQTTSFTGTVTVPTLNLQTQLNLNNNIVSNGATITPVELSYIDGVTSNIQTQINTKSNSANPTFTGTITAPVINASGLITANGSLTVPTGQRINLLGDISANNSLISPTELSYLDNVTSNIQTQINTKSNSANPTFTGTITAPIINASGLITANAGLTVPSGQRINLVGDISANGTTISPTELSYLDNATSNIQTQINTKAPINNPTFTGTATAPILTASSQVRCPNYSISNVRASETSYNATALINPIQTHGIGIGTGDGPAYDLFNQGIYSWYGTGFVDTCFKTCNAVIDHRTGDFKTLGNINCNTVTATNNVSANNQVTSSNGGSHIFALNDASGNQTIPLTINSSSVSIPGGLTVGKIDVSTPMASNIAGFVRGGFGFQPIFGSVADTASYGPAVYTGSASRQVVTNIDTHYVIFPKYKIVPYKHPGYPSTGMYSNLQAYDNTNGSVPIYVNAAANDVGSIKVYYNNVEVVVGGLS